MLSIYTIKSAKDAAHYYEKDDYYTKDDPEHKKYSQWYGKAAKHLELSGQVDKEQFLQLLEGKLPNGTQLGRRKGDKIKHACGVDLTFSAPKSVSILSEFLGDKKVREAHEKAVKKVIDYVENKCLVKIRRRIDGKIVKEAANNVLVSLYRHNTSRAGDMHCHDHTVWQNMAMDKEGVWRSVDFKELFQNKMLLGLMYRSYLAYDLRQMGYTINQREKGLFEVAGIPQELIDLFSKRSMTIKEALKQYDFQNAKTKALLAKITRESKKQINRHEFSGWWKEQAQDKHFIFSNLEISKIQESGRIDQAKIESLNKKDVGVFNYMHQRWENITSYLSSTPPRRLEGVDDNKDSKMPLAERAIMYAIKHLTERTAVFTEEALEQHALEYGLGEIIPDQILKAKEKLIKDGTLLESKHGTNISSLMSDLKKVI